MNNEKLGDAWPFKNMRLGTLNKQSSLHGLKPVIKHDIFSGYNNGLTYLRGEDRYTHMDA